MYDWNWDYRTPRDLLGRDVVSKEDYLEVIGKRMEGYEKGHINFSNIEDDNLSCNPKFIDICKHYEDIIYDAVIYGRGINYSSDIPHGASEEYESFIDYFKNLDSEIFSPQLLISLYELLYVENSGITGGDMLDELLSYLPYYYKIHQYYVMSNAIWEGDSEMQGFKMRNTRSYGDNYLENLDLEEPVRTLADERGYIDTPFCVEWTEEDLDLDYKYKYLTMDRSKARTLIEGV